MLNRRAFIQAASSVLAGTVLAEEAPRPLGVPLKLEPLGFDFDALEPYMDAQSLRFHHDVYHAGCLAELQEALTRVNLTVANVTTLMPNMQSLVRPDDQRSVLTLAGRNGTLPLATKEAIRKLGGSHVNHTAFWRFLAPPARGRSGPIGKSAAAIQTDFGGLSDFKEAFTKAALDHCGSGWVWLSYRYDGKLIVSTTANEDNPMMKEHVAWQEQGRPILCLDLWEHSYFPQYQNDRRKYITNWWKVVNWDFVDRAYGIVKGQV